MNKILGLMLAVMIGMTTVVTESQAKRFGGSKSFGKQREQITQPAAPAPAKPVGAPAAAGGKSWMGPLAGLAAGGLLAALFMGGAFDGIKFFDIVLIALLAFGLFYLFRKLRQNQAQPGMQYAGMSPAPHQPNLNPGLNPGSLGSGTLVQPSTRPDWFEDEPFLRAAKMHFLRLQEAYDRADLNDIREYTTPEVFAEIRLQLEERGATPNKTDVVQLNAQMVDVATEGDQVVASVRFSGLIREDEATAQPFDEIWHIQKSATDRDAAWFVAGIQQIQ